MPSAPPSGRHVLRLAVRRHLAGAFALAAALALACVALPACSDDSASPADAGPPDAGPPDGSAVDPDAGDGAATSLVHVQILAINDFHGNLEAPAGTNGLLAAHANDPSLANHDAGSAGDLGNGEIAIRAGGASFLAARIKSLRADNPQTIVVSAGDLSGASPLLSGLFHDEPSVLAMSSLGLDLNAVGNHEFDHGAAELLRLQNGGCHPVDGCTKGQPTFPGAKFHYLAANVNTAMKQTLFRPYEIKTFDGEKLAFIGMTLEDTPGVVTASAVAGLTFANEVATVNALLPELKTQGVAGIVVLVHQGSAQVLGSTYDECGVDGGPIALMAAQLDPAVDVVVSAHTHEPYVCNNLGGKLVTSAASYGRIVTKIDLTIDKLTHHITAKTAKNLPVLRDAVPDTDVASIVSTYQTLSAPLANRVIGHITANLPLAPVDVNIGESLLGDVIADAQLEATSAAGGPGAVVAFMNPGGIRADLLFAHGGQHPDGEVTYSEAFSVQPFTNLLVTMTLTGAQVKEVLEAQFLSAPPRTLQVSSSLSYTFDPLGAVGNHVDPAQVLIGGVALDLAASYRVTVNNFLAGGGDGFSAFAKGTNRVTGGSDLDGLVAYFGAHDPLVQPVGGRIKKKP